MTAPADSATWAGPDGPGARPRADAGRLLRVVAAQRDLACTGEDAAAVFGLLAECVLSIFAAEGALAAQPAGPDIVARASAGTCGPAVGTTIPQAGTLAGLALSTLQPQICHDSHTDPRTRADINEQAGTRSSIIVPLVDAGEPLGIVLALSSVPYAFDDGDLALLTLLADVAASSLRRALLRGQHEDLEKGRRRDDARLRAAQELTGLAWWALDVNTDRHEWSDAMFRLVGLEPSADAPSGAEFLALVHPQDRPTARDLADRGYVSGHGDVFRVIHPDGSAHFLQSWTDIETDADGRTTRVIGATIDVTEREEALASLEVSQANLAAALELTRTATWEWDVRDDRIIWSERMTELMGWPKASQATPRVEDFLSCVHPDDRDRMRSLGERTIATGRGEEAVYRIRLRDGHVRHVRAWTDVRTAPDGSVVALWGTAMDITAQVEQTTRLAASEEHFRVAFDNAPIGMSMISLTPDTAGRYLRANHAFEEMVGYGREDLVGRHILELTHPADTERDAGFLRRLVDRETTTVAFEKRYRRPDGTAVQAWLTSSVVHDADGRPLYLVSHAMDITDRLREQAELERLALTDTLTGLANRTLLDDRLDQALARLQRSGGVCAMLLLDVDRFKLVNDSLGHQVGDALLVEIAGRLETVTRAETTVARLGGDEFVVLVEGLRAPEEIHAIAARLLDTLRRPYALGPTAESLVATVSLGVSVAASPDRTHLDLYREADLALYRAKDAGRDQYALFDDALRARADARLESETLLRRALADDRLVALLQPIVDLGDGRVHAAEGLARLETEDGRLVHAGRLHRRRGGDRPDRRGGLADGGAGGRRLRGPQRRGSGHAADSHHQRVGQVPRGPDVRRPRAPCPDVVRRARLGGPRRAHRAQPADHQPARARVARPARGARRPGRARRLRHRLLGAGLPAAVRVAVPQDRPVVRQPAGHERARRRRRRRGHRPGARARPRRRRRGRRDGGTARAAPRDGLRPRAGLPVGQAHAPGGPRGPPAGRPPLVTAKVDHLCCGRVDLTDDVVGDAVDRHTEGGQPVVGDARHVR